MRLNASKAKCCHIKQVSCFKKKAATRGIRGLSDPSCHHVPSTKFLSYCSQVPMVRGITNLPQATPCSSA